MQAEQVAGDQDRLRNRAGRGEPDSERRQHNGVADQPNLEHVSNCVHPGRGRLWQGLQGQVPQVFCAQRGGQDTHPYYETQEETD